MKGFKKGRIRMKGNAKIQNAKKKTVDGINFKSSLEAFCYTELKKAGIKDFEYEGHQFILQNKFDCPLISYEVQSKKKSGKITKTFDVNPTKLRAITYTPDFVYLNDNKEGWIIETKGFKTVDFKIKWKMFKRVLMENGFKVTLYVPDNQKNVLQTINLIKNNLKK